MARKKSIKRSRVAGTSMAERVATLEVLMATQVATSESLDKSVSEIKSSLQRYQGFWGAVTLIGSAIFTLFALFKDNLTNVFTGK